MRYRFRSSAIIWTLIAINVFIFILINALSKIAPTTDIGVYLALYNPITQFNYYWTIVTSIFVHVDFSHILGNMIVLYFFGTFCLQVIDTKWFLLVYFIGGIFGNILYLLIGPEGFVIGASGAIFAIGGVLAVMRPTQTVYLYFLIPMPLFLVVILGFVISYFSSGVAWQAHLGGLIVGLIAGYFFRWTDRKRLRPGQYNIQW